MSAEDRIRRRLADQLDIRTDNVDVSLDLSSLVDGLTRVAVRSGARTLAEARAALEAYDSLELENVVYLSLDLYDDTVTVNDVLEHIDGEELTVHTPIDEALRIVRHRIISRVASRLVGRVREHAIRALS